MRYVRLTILQWKHNNSFYYQSFIYSPTDALVSCLKNNIKIYIKTAPTCFGAVTPSSRRALIRAYYSYSWKARINALSDDG